MHISSDGNVLPYAIPDDYLGEKLYPNEEALAAQIADAIEKSVRAHYQAGDAHRDVHAKATGCLEAEFRVNDSLPDNLAKGVFAPGKAYRAWIRFSNGSGDPYQADDSNDAHGMAIKLMGVPGEKILENDRNATTQDFIMFNHPVFLTNDPHTYLSLIEKGGSTSLVSKLTISFMLGLKGTMLAQELQHGKISNPVQVQYFSAVPFQLGTGPDRQAIKFSAKPSIATVDPIPDHPGHNYLRDALRATLQKSDVSMNFLVQPRTSDSMSVEDAMTKWDEEQAPFYEVATVNIPRQDFDTPERNQFGENLSFSPWHALPEHRPLGSINRIRKIVYERISRVRHEMNTLERREP